MIVMKKLIALFLLLSLTGCNGLKLGQLSLGPNGEITIDAKLPQIGDE